MLFADYLTVIKRDKKLKKWRNMQKVIYIVLALLACAISFTGCTTGGYFQVGYIPVTEVRDVHTTVKSRNIPSKVKHNENDF